MSAEELQRVKETSAAYAAAATSYAAEAAFRNWRNAVEAAERAGFPRAAIVAETDAGRAS